MADSIEIALSLSDGLVYVQDAETNHKTVFSAKFACPVTGFTIDEIEPRLFSFNNPFGACPSCDGLGVSSHFDEQLVIPNTKLSLREGALAPWANSSSKYYLQTLQSIANQFGFSIDVAFEELPDIYKDIILHGSGEKPVEMIYDDGIRSYKTLKPFEGILPNLERRYRETDSNWVREELEKYRRIQPCDSCGGKRLKKESLAVKILNKDISDISALSIGDAVDWFAGLNSHLSAKDKEIASRILKEINERLGFLDNVGLNYLNLSRNSGTLSGGESQRIRLASQIGSGLTGYYTYLTSHL